MSITSQLTALITAREHLKQAYKLLANVTDSQTISIKRIATRVRNQEGFLDYAISDLERQSASEAAVLSAKIKEGL